MPHRGQEGAGDLATSGTRGGVCASKGDETPGSSLRSPQLSVQGDCARGSKSSIQNQTLAPSLS